MGKTVVLYPSPGMGHLVSMVELAKLVLGHGFSVNIITVEAPYNTGSTASFIARVSSAYPSISFHRLPPVSLPPKPYRHYSALRFDLLRLSNPNLLHALNSISETTTIRALILDFFCTDALDVAAELHIPSYIFFTSGASILAAFLYLPTLDLDVNASFKDLGDSPLHFPGVPPIPASHMPLPMLDREDIAYNGYLHHFGRMPRAAGIIVNTFESLEMRALGATRDGLCTPGRPIPPVYCVGPLITDGSRGGEGGEDKHGCLAWLDSQPRASVVFLSFGSVGQFSAAQLKEMAAGLERSGQRFLWVVRSPPSDDPAKRFEAPPEPDLDVLLPDGFLERTKERGLVVKSWAPQVAVLAHESVGGFVTHCGWNSVLEAVCAGVPMIAWPLYAEQRMNKVMLVEEMRLAMELKGYDEELVRAGELEEKIKQLMESEEGKELRKHMLATKERATAALREGGSSHAALTELASAWKQTD